MPELPEVEVVRRGLAGRLLGATIGTVDVLHPRPVRHHLAGPVDFAARLAGVAVTDVMRRGKFLWLCLDSGEALLVHLGMSGQLVLVPPGTPNQRNLRVRFELDGVNPELELRFVDQRMFGGLAVLPLEPTPDGLPAGMGATGEPAALLPPPVRHIARDPLDPHLDEPALLARIRRRRTGIKRAMLDQTLVSGIGNIYADEALWGARLHFARPTETLSRPAALRLLVEVREVMRAALAQGGTSFDDLYIDVNGASGYFERSLEVYGRAGAPCRRCGTPIRRDPFMNRSAYSCPRCQPRPRHGRW